MATIWKTLIVRGWKDISKNVLTKSKKLLDRVLLQITQIDNVHDIALSHEMPVLPLYRNHSFELHSNEGNTGI